MRNDGIIVARLGSVALAAGDRVSLDLVGDGLINISVDQAALNASVVNTGTIEADGGRIIIMARSANALLDSVINSSGVLRANSLVERNGEIVLDAGAGSVSVSGTDAVTATGGSISIGSDNLTLNGEGTLAAPSGSIAIGSGNVTLSGSTSINASGTSVQVTGNTMTIAGNTTILSTGGGGAPVALSEEELKLRAAAINLTVTGSTVGEMVREAARVAHAVTTNVPLADYRQANVLTGPIMPAPPLRHQMQSTGVSMPAGAMLPAR